MSSVPPKSSRMTRKQRRLALIGSALAVLGIAAGLVLYALNDSIVFFRSPSDVTSMGIKPGTRFRIGHTRRSRGVVGAEFARPARRRPRGAFHRSGSVVITRPATQSGRRSELIRLVAR